MNETHPIRIDRRGVTRAALVILCTGAVLLGVLSGAVWKDRIAKMLGITADEPSSSSSGAATQLWTCGMHPQVIQKEPGDCPICHMKLTPLAASAPSSGAAESQRRIKYWWDPMMNPPFIAPGPGKSPMGMDLVPVYADELAAGPAITIEPSVEQNMGVRTAEVVVGSLVRTIRLLGVLEEPEPNHVDINLRVSGWIENLYAATDGEHVIRGAPLFDLYSPDLQVAVEELIGARKSGAVSGHPGEADLYALAKQKLELLGLAPQEVERMALLDRAPHSVAFNSPINGHVTAKMVYPGAAVKAGDLVMRLADSSTMWLDLAVFESQLPFIQIGQRVTASVAAIPGRAFEGKVSFFHPHLDMATRTAKARVTLPNADLVLREGMYATAEITAEIAPRALLVPREAVIDTGARQIAFVALEGGRFEATRVRLGASGDDGLVQVLEGLAPGEKVVRSGQFLLDSESRIQEAVQKFLDDGRPGARRTISRAAAPEASVALIDVVIADYLALTSAIGKAHGGSFSSEAARLVVDVQKLVDESKGPTRFAAEELRTAAFALLNQPYAKLLEVLQSASDAAIAIARRSPPSAKIGEKLYVVRCPMKGVEGGMARTWLQTSTEIANPYDAGELRSCGEVIEMLVLEKGAGR